MPRSIRVKDIMNPQPPAIHCDTSIIDVITTLLEQHVGGAPVVDDYFKLIGYVSEQHCIRRVLEDSYYCEPSTQVSELMDKEVITVSPEDSIVDVAQLMQDKPCADYPVVEENKLVGLITRGDILRALAKELKVCH